MKKFLINLFLFAIIHQCVFYAKPLYLLYTNQYKFTVAGNEVYKAIEKSKKKKKKKKILIGDSIANQMFFVDSTEKENFSYIATNQAISMAGQFILINNLIESGNKIDTLWIIFSPFSFSNNLDQKFTYHYFIKPFYTDQNIDLFTENTLLQIKKIPYVYLKNNPFVLTSNWAPGFVSNDINNFSFLSPTSKDYLQKIKELSVKFNFKIKIISPPLNIKNKPLIEKMNMEEITNNHFDELFEGYIDHIIYLEEKCFIDGVHLKNPKNFADYYFKHFL